MGKEEEKKTKLENSWTYFLRRCRVQRRQKGRSGEEGDWEMNDWKKSGVEHLERPGCIINILAKLADKDGREVTHIEILPDNGWLLEGYVKNRVIRRKD